MEVGASLPPYLSLISLIAASDLCRMTVTSSTVAATRFFQIVYWAKFLEGGWARGGQTHFGLISTGYMGLVMDTQRKSHGLEGGGPG